VTDLLIREITAADRPALMFIFRRLSADSRYQRFLTPKPALTGPELGELIAVDHWHHEALIAWSPTPRAPIAVARYIRGRDFDVAELAVTVVDEWQRRGVGTELLRALRTRAERAGIRCFTATMLWGNRGAVQLLRGLGPVTTTRSGGGIVELAGCWR
jgi:RimJ/RimL family protein N-acetyltransferase